MRQSLPALLWWNTATRRGKSKRLPIEPGDLFLDIEAGSYTPAEFEEKYLSPDYDPQAERYGKTD